MLGVVAATNDFQLQLLHLVARQFFLVLPKVSGNKGERWLRLLALNTR
jgi:hypothetical protein